MRRLPVSSGWRRHARRLDRFRYLAKARIVRRYDVRLREQPRLVLGYMLLDPELESFSYELGNREAFLDFLADVLRADRVEVARYADEVRAGVDPRPPRSRRLQHKRRLPIANRLGAYVAIRVLRPSLVVETGVHDGLGSLTMLRALARNADEGDDGRLISVDLNADAGWLVDPGTAAGRWQRVTGRSTEVLGLLLADQHVDLSVHDASADPAVQTAEFAAIVPHRGPCGLTIINSAGPEGPALAAVCAAAGGTEHRFRTTSRAHVHPGNPIAFATFR